MNRSVLTGALLGGAAVTALGAVAGYRAIAMPATARVVSVHALTRMERIPHHECRDEQVTRVKQPRDQNRLVGTGIGAALGGLVGNQIGGGTGKVLATVAGVAAGGYAGNQVEERMQRGNTYTTTEQRCRTVYEPVQRPAGYEVVYELHGQRHSIRMDHDPGSRLPVKDGHVVVAEAGAGDAPVPPSRG
jgi:uncharacterized protein YcfJ